MPRVHPKPPEESPGTSAAEPESVPHHLAGSWIAWTPDGLRIIASGATLADVKAGAKAAGVLDPLVELVPPATRLA